MNGEIDRRGYLRSRGVDRFSSESDVAGCVYGGGRKSVYGGGRKSG